MEGVFLEVLNMSISASWLILAVIVIRAFTKKAPKGLRYVLWAFVAIRLLCPFSVESAWSLIPSAETFSKESMYSNTLEIQSGVVVLDEAVNSALSEQTSSDADLTGDISAENQDANVGNGSAEQEILPDETVNINDVNTGNVSITKNKISLQGIVYIAARIWIVGLLGMLVYSLISFIRLRNIIEASLQIGDKLWVCDEIQSPFIFGLIRPRIWIVGIGIVACVIVAICFVTNPAGADILNPIENVAKIELRSGNNGHTVEITDAETIARITDNVNEMEFVREGSNWGTGGWSYWLKWYDADGNEIESLVVLGNNRISGEHFFYKSTKGAFDYEFYDELLKNDREDSVENTELERTETTEDTGEIEIMGTPLSETELEWFARAFFNSDENLMPNMFLASEYDCPENIDINNLFYGGSDGKGGGEISKEEERLLLEQYYDEWLLDVSRTTADEMDDILMKYMNITLADTNKKHIESLYYLEEYEAYYNVAGDTEYSKYELLAGWTNENGTITIVYKDALNSVSQNYQVTLEQENGNYYFISNIQMPIDMRVFEANKATDEQIDESENYVDAHISMWNEENGYIFRCSTPAASQMTKILCKTSDGGDTFEEYLDVSSLRNYPCDIYFFTENIGYIITDYHGSHNFLYRTEDGGQTWRGQMIYVPVSGYRYVNGKSMDNGILRIQVETNDEIYHFEYETDDMGKTWKLR